MDAVPQRGGNISQDAVEVSKILNRYESAVIKETADAIHAIRNGIDKSGLTCATNSTIRLVRNVSERISSNLSPLPPAVKGVSYNPWGAGVRESLLLLDFFSILRRFAGQLFTQSAILDAGPYWMVNQRSDDMIIRGKHSNQAAQELLEKVLKSASTHNPAYEVALLRNAYLRAIAHVFPSVHSPTVFSITDVWKDDRFFPYLVKSFDYLCDARDGAWHVIDPIPYHRYHTYSSWFTALVAAEQVFLADIGFGSFFAPVQEMSWNTRADQLGAVMNTPPYIRLYYKRPSKIWYDDYSRLPSFDDTALSLETKLENPALKKWILELIEAFEEVQANPSDKVAVTSILHFTERIQSLVDEMRQSEIPDCPIMLKW